MGGDNHGQADSPPASVRATYDRIADHFATTREHPWPEVVQFVEREATERGGSLNRVIDIGCANGRHTELLADHGADPVGIDVSRELLRAGQRRAAERDFSVSWVCGDAARLPIADNTVSVAIYVATLHHLRPRAARIESLNELARVLTPGGRALVSAWSTEHDRFDATAAFDTTVEWTLPGGETVPRFYHIYSPAEFRDDLARSALDAIDVKISSGNCYATVAVCDASPREM